MAHYALGLFASATVLLAGAFAEIISIILRRRYPNGILLGPEYYRPFMYFVFAVVLLLVAICIYLFMK